MPNIDSTTTDTEEQQLIEGRYPKPKPKKPASRIILQGKCYLIEQWVEDGTYFGHVQGFKFAGLRKKEDAIAWCMEKFDQCLAARIAGQ